MKKLIFTLVVAFYAVSAFAQGSNLVFFAEQGEKFFVILNGIRQNEVAQTNVKVTNIAGSAVKIKIIFEDKALGEIDRNIFFQEFPSEMTINIRKDKSGTKYVLRMFDAVPIAQAPPTPPTATVITYTTTPAPVAPVTNTTVTHSTTTTTVGQPVPSDNVNVNIGIGVPGGGFGMNVNINDGTTFQQNTNVTTTTTTTTTGTVAPAPVAPAPTQPTYVMPGYNGPIGCSWPMSDGDFASAKGSIASKSFEDSKLTIAKQIFNTNCLTSNQVREIMLLFTFEDSRLDFAKYAYGRTYDIGNYYKVNDAFTFELSIDDLNAYINGFRR